MLTPRLERRQDPEGFVFGETRGTTGCRRKARKWLPLQARAIVCCPEVEQRAFGNDTSGVNGRVTHVLVALDMYEIDGLRHTGFLIEFARVIPEIWIVDEPSQIAFEMAVVN